MNRRVVSKAFLLIGAGIVIYLIFRGTRAPDVAWEQQLPENEYVHCLAIHESSERAVLVAGIQKGNYGSRDYDSYIVCLNLATGDELWRRDEKESGNLRGGKRPSSIGFDSSGDLIVGWDYFAVRDGNLETVSKLSVRDGAVVWDWSEPSEGVRMSDLGYRHGSTIRCEGADILVRTERAVGTIGEVSDMRVFFSVINSHTGKPAGESTALSGEAKARWESGVKQLQFTALDGSEIHWKIMPYSKSKINWLKWRKDHHLGIWRPKSDWESGERILVTRTRPPGSGNPDYSIIGRDKERALMLLYVKGDSIPSAAFLADMSAEPEVRKWRVVRLVGGTEIGGELAQGVGVSHNYNGPIIVTKSGVVVMSGSMLGRQDAQSITVWR